MKRYLIRFTLSVVALAGAATAAFAAEPQSRPPAASASNPNILWLIAEDFGPHLGCYGTAQVSTPNLDRLAAGGMRFTRAYTTAPVCSARPNASP